MISRALLSLTALSFFMAPFGLSAQDEQRPIRTLIGGGRELDHGGWGAATTHYTRVMDKDALLVGVRGGWLIDHRVTLGFAGHGLVTPVPNSAYDAHLIANGEVLRRKSSLHMGYGGLFIEPIIAYRSPVHISLPLIVGAGGATYGYESRLPVDLDPHAYEHHSDAQAFFVVEPGIELEFNVIPLVRLGFGASYRYTSDLDMPVTPKDALHGMNLGVSVKVGRF